MNGTFHLIKNDGEEIWLDGENIERFTKYDEKYDKNEKASLFCVEVARKCIGIELAKKPEIIMNVADVVFYPNTKEKKEL